VIEAVQFFGLVARIDRARGDDDLRSVAAHGGTGRRWGLKLVSGATGQYGVTASVGTNPGVVAWVAKEKNVGAGPWPPMNAAMWLAPRIMLTDHLSVQVAVMVRASELSPGAPVEVLRSWVRKGWR
jgi:hypothetical protein